METLPVEYHNIFAKHSMDIGINTGFKVKLAPKEDKAVYSQNLPMLFLLKEDVIVDLALLYRYGIFKALPLSKYVDPIFAHKKPNGKLGLLVDLR